MRREDKRLVPQSEKKINFLTQQQLYQLYRHLEAEKAYINERMMSLDEAAAYLTEKAGFKVTVSNVILARKVTNITWPLPRKPVNKDKMAAKRTERSNKRALFIHTLRMVVVELCEGLGKDVPPILLEDFEMGLTYQCPARYVPPHEVTQGPFKEE